MKFHTQGTVNIKLYFLRAGILCLTLILGACSHETMTATEPSKVETDAEIPEVIKTGPTLPTAQESTKPEPVAEKPVVNTVPNELAILKPGQSASLDASTALHYVRLVNDSRCPADAQCIWAGEATIELTLESDSGKETFTLSDRANTKESMGFGIELISIDREHLINIRAQKR